MYESLPRWVQELLPIAILLAVVTGVVLRLPKVDVGHSPEFRTRRFTNWLPVGLTYAFLYFARYNLTAYKTAVEMTNDAYGTIDLWGAVTYGFAFVLNGPLADRLGGRMTLLFAAVGAAAANLAMGVYVGSGWSADKVTTLTILYSANMYFQSFGAVSIVKVNAAWFHLRERGTFGGIFGILISLGLYFAYDWARKITEVIPNRQWVFFIPAIVLIVMAVIDAAWVKDTPGKAGHRDFDPGDASSGDDGPRLSVWQVAKRMLSTRAIVIIALIEFCSGFLRNAVMKWYPVYAKGIGINKTFVPSNWGMLICCAGILGGIFAGLISDYLFNHRRGPISTILYAAMLGGIGLMWVTMGTGALGWTVIFLSLCVIGVHGMLSGAASMDFGGKKNVGTAVGIIDGCVYLGTAVQAGVLKNMLPDGPAQADPANWRYWPVAMLPVAVIGTLLASRVWNARPTKAAAH